jgi:hypothetical protein
MYGPRQMDISDISRLRRVPIFQGSLDNPMGQHYDQIFLLEPITYNNSWTGSVLSTTTSPADNVLFSLHLIDMGTEMYGDSILCQFGDTTILTDGRHSSDFQGQKGFMSEVLGVNLLP